MPRQKDLKRLVRTRMQKTGESYTAARAQILNRKAKKTTSSGEAVSAADYAKLAGMSDTTVEAKTGCTWERWVEFLDHFGAAELPHREIAALVHEKWKLSGWWSQTVTVGYERIKGLRERGQRRSGYFEVSKSKTFNVPIAELFDAVNRKKLRERWLPDAVKVRKASKFRSVRLDMKDGAIAAFGFTEKGASKTTISVQQEKLPDKATQDRLKKYWGERLTALTKVVS